MVQGYKGVVQGPCFPRVSRGLYRACVQVVLEPCGWVPHLGLTPLARGVSGHIYVSDMAALGLDAVVVVVGPRETRVKAPCGLGCVPG